MMKTLKPRTRYTASRTAMAASQVWVRGQDVFHPVHGLEGPDAPVHGLPAALDLDTETGPVLEPDAEVQLGGLRGCYQFVDLGLAVAEAVISPGWGELRLYVHLMMSLFEIFDDWPIRV